MYGKDRKAIVTKSSIIYVWQGSKYCRSLRFSIGLKLTTTWIISGTCKMAWFYRPKLYKLHRTLNFVWAIQWLDKSHTHGNFTPSQFWITNVHNKNYTLWTLFNLRKQWYPSSEQSSQHTSDSPHGFFSLHFGPF